VDTHNDTLAFKELKIPEGKSHQKVKEQITLHSLLNHPFIIKPVGYLMNSPSTMGYYMEWATRGSLYNKIHTPNESVLAVKYALQISEAMVYLYSRDSPVSHKNLKTKNILINQDGDLKVADFGLGELIAGWTESLLTTLSFQVILAPERFCITAKGSPEVAEKGDVFSFGLVLWEMLTRDDPGPKYYQLPKEDISTHFELEPSVQHAIKGNKESEAFLLSVAKGARPKLPENCPHQEYVVLMQRCWHQNPEERPTFQEIKEMLSKDPVTFEVTYPSPSAI